jgi:hypothetical protein
MRPETLPGQPRFAGALVAALQARFPAAVDPGTRPTPSAGIFVELDRLEATLAAVDTDEDTCESIATRLRTILSRWAASTPETNGDATDTRKRRLESATLGEVLDLIDAEFGNS